MQVGQTKNKNKNREVLIILINLGKRIGVLQAKGKSPFVVKSINFYKPLLFDFVKRSY